MRDTWSDRVTRYEEGQDPGNETEKEDESPDKGRGWEGVRETDELRMNRKSSVKFTVNKSLQRV